MATQNSIRNTIAGAAGASDTPVPTPTSTTSTPKAATTKPVLRNLAYFSRFFQFPHRSAYLIVASLLLANGIAHGTLAYHYYRDPKGTKEYLISLPDRLRQYQQQQSSNENK